MKRSVAMMACVLSGALMICSYSPVFAEGTKTVSAKSADTAEYISYAGTLVMLVLCIISLSSSTFNPFIYLQF